MLYCKVRCIDGQADPEQILIRPSLSRGVRGIKLLGTFKLICKKYRTPRQWRRRQYLMLACTLMYFSIRTPVINTIYEKR